MGSIETYENDLEAPLIDATRSVHPSPALSCLTRPRPVPPPPSLHSEYYQIYVDKCAVDDSTPTYLLRVERVIEEERNRIHSYLNLITESKLFHVLDTVLIESKLTLLIDKEGSGLRVLLQNDRLDDIIRMYQLFNRLKGGVGVHMMADILRDYIIQLGNDIILERKVKLETMLTMKASPEEGPAGGGAKPSSSSSKAAAPSASSGGAAAAAGAAAGGGEKINSEKEMYLIDVQYLKDLMTIHEKYLTIIKTHLQNNALFHKSIKDSFSHILNKDLMKASSSGPGGSSAALPSSSANTPSSTSIQIINTFCDNILKVNSYEKITSESEIEIFLERLVQLFTYVTDKDLFNEIYRNLLAKRLLSQRSSSDDMERLMISKLKLRCGSQFTSKIEGMLTDLQIASDHQSAFVKFVTERNIVLGGGTSGTTTGPVDFSVQVLTTGYWPTYKVYDIVLPTVMNNCCKVLDLPSFFSLFLCLSLSPYLCLSLCLSFSVCLCLCLCLSLTLSPHLSPHLLIPLRLSMISTSLRPPSVNCNGSTVRERPPSKPSSPLVPMRSKSQPSKPPCCLPSPALPQLPLPLSFSLMTILWRCINCQMKPSRE
jgi:hypothetical protein